MLSKIEQEILKIVKKIEITLEELIDVLYYYGVCGVIG